MENYKIRAFDCGLVQALLAAKYSYEAPMHASAQLLSGLYLIED